MTRRAHRRMKYAAALGAAVAAFALWVGQLDATLARSGQATGLLLYAAVVGLAALQLRKRLQGLPVGSATTWVRVHVATGLASGALALLHVGLRWPDGWLEGALAAVYAATFVSGLVGLYWSRTIPKQLARAGEQFVYERIPRLRRRVQFEAREAVLRGVIATGSTTLADFYTERVHGFLHRPRALAYTLRPSTGTRKRLFRELGGLRRVLSEPERQASERLFALVRQKDDLDFHAARQGLLKIWLFGHVALTWSLLLLGAAHGVLALAFRGGPS
ncbi:MAG: hypothetical protein ACRCT8_17590 [Lacipirellulaceae bacterium]